MISFPGEPEPSWRTDTVRSLCEAMRTAGDYSACPALADALEDAGFGSGLWAETTSLEILRDLETPFWELERLVAVVYSQESARAVGSLEAFARRVELTYEEAVEGGRAYVRTGICYKPGNQNWEPYQATDDEGECERYYELFERVTGTVVPVTRRNHRPFTCPC